MNSVELNHFKMDPHYQYKEANTYKKLIKLEKIKDQKDLNLKEVKHHSYKKINIKNLFLFKIRHFPL